MKHAVCATAPRDPSGFDPFFPKRGEAAKALKVARAMCDECPVRAACAEHRRLTGSKFGIWAGTIYNPEKTPI